MDNKETLINHIEDKVPKLRFPEFTDPWEQRKLGDFGKATGGTSIESEFSKDGKYKVISIGSYSENSIYNDQGIRAIESDKTSNLVLNRNDLTMILNDKTTSGNIIGRVLLIEKSGIYVYNQRTERIETNLDEYDSVFLYEMLNAPNIRAKIIKQAQGNTQIYVNWTTISLLDYMIPSKEEQVKIGKYLHGISNLITLHQRKLILLNKYKRGLFSIFFDNIPKEWVKYKLKEISLIKSGEFVIKSKQKSNGQYPVYNGGTTYTGFYNNYNNKGNKIVISARGNAGYVNFVEQDFWAGNSCYVIESKDNIKFLYYQIKYKQNNLYKIQQSATIPSILKKDIERINLYIPPLEEQNKIAKILSTYDSLIDKETQILNQLKSMKVGLLQQMFI